MSKIAFLFLLIASLSTTYAQKSREPKVRKADNISLIAAQFSFGWSAVGGDLKTRFGPQTAVGIGAEFLSKTNWIAASNAQYFFGNMIKDDPLASLRTPEGLLIGNDRRTADVTMKGRGWAAGVSVGRLFNFSEKQRASGLRLTVGAGWQQHKIRLQDDGLTIVQIIGDYGKGYDRLAGGWNLTESIGWQYYAKNRRGNFFIGIDFMQSRARSLRDFDFALGQKDDSKRLDLRFLPRVAVCLPFYLKDKSEDVFY